MKNKFLLLFSLFLWSSVYLTAQNSLSVSDPQWWCCAEPAEIDEALITAEPKGLYTEVGMYLTFSALDGWFFLHDTLEVVLDFELPADALVVDSWLWVDDIIVQGKIIDRWTASEIFEEIVDRRQDPSILFKNGADQYQLRIFPMAGTESRKVKLTFLMPTEWSLEKVISHLPMNILRTSAEPIEDFRVLVRGENEWQNPQILNHSEIGFTPIQEPGLGYFEQANLSAVPSTLGLTFDAPLQNGVYVSKAEHNGENLYQMALLPTEIVDFETSHKIMVIIDYNSAYTTLSRQEVVVQVKNQLLNQLKDNDFFNVAVYDSGTVHQQVEWQNATTQNIEMVFEELENDLSVNGDLNALLGHALDFVQNNGNDAEFLLVSNANPFGEPFFANSLIDGVLNEMGETVLPIHIADYQNQGFSYHWLENGEYYQGADYLFLNLSRLTGGGYLRWFDNSNSLSENISPLLQQIQQIDASFDVQTSLAGGFCYDRYELTFQGQSSYVNEPFLQVGKYIGEFPFELSFATILEDNTFIHNELLVSEEEAFTADSTLSKMWSGHFLKKLEASGTSNNIVTQIINKSISERVLSLYTAFLCLEPGLGGEPCPDCFNEGDDEVLISVENPENPEITVAAYPNPFDNQTTLSIILNNQISSEDIQIEVYNILGQKMKDISKADYRTDNQRLEVTWDARDNAGKRVEKGTYFFVVKIGDYTEVVKVMFVG